MEEFELDYDIQEVRLSEDLVYKVTTVANEALPLEMLLDLETRSEEISGQRLWEGSLLLCSYLVEACKVSDTTLLNFNGKAVLELGAGTGVVGMLAHGLGAAPVVMTDGDDKCVAMAQMNVKGNGIAKEEAFVSVLRWGEDESTSAFCEEFSGWERRRKPGEDSLEARGDGGVEEAVEVKDGTAVRHEDGVAHSSSIPVVMTAKKMHEPLPKKLAAGKPSGCPLRYFDFVLAGDVLYKQSLLAPFLGTVQEMLARGGKLLLCHVPRAGVTYDIVEQAFLQAGFVFEVLNGKYGGHVVGGVELCADDARRARLYSVFRVDESLENIA